MKFTIFLFLCITSSLCAVFKTGDIAKITKGKKVGETVQIVDEVQYSTVFSTFVGEEGELFHSELARSSELKYIRETFNSHSFTFDEKTLFYRVKIGKTFPPVIYIIPDIWLENVENYSLALQQIEALTALEHREAIKKDKKE